MIESFSDEQLQYLLNLEPEKLRDVVKVEYQKRIARKYERRKKKRQRSLKRKLDEDTHVEVKREVSDIRVKVEKSDLGISFDDMVQPKKIEPLPEPPKKRRVTYILLFF